MQLDELSLKFKADLLTVQHRAGECQVELSELRENVSDEADKSSLNEEIDRVKSEFKRLNDRSISLRGALFKIEHGEYGDCVECGNDIPKARLEAYPTCEHCVECLSQIEKRDRHLPKAS